MRLVAALLIAFVLGSRLLAGVDPASACTCALISTPEEVRVLVSDAPLAVIASVDGFTSSEPEARLMMTVDRVLNGLANPGTIIVDQTRQETEAAKSSPGSHDLTGPDCSYLIAGIEGEQYVFIGYPGDSGVWQTSSCSGTIRVSALAHSAYLEHWKILLDPTLFPSGGGPPTQDLREQAADAKELPWAPILIIALAIPAAALVIPSFFGKKGSGGR